MVISENTNIVIDAGPDFRQQMLVNGVNNISAILLTHEHNDHIIGLDDVRPFNFLYNKNIPVYTTPRVIAELRKRFAYIFQPNPYPGAPRLELNPIIKNEPFNINGIKIIPVEVMHGQMPVLGFRINDITYLTDVKRIDGVELLKAKNSKILVLNALHHRKHHSHLNLAEALELIEKLEPDYAYLTHMSHRMGLHAEVNAQLPKNVKLAYDGLVVENL